MPDSIRARFNPELPHSVVLLGIQRVEKQTGLTGISGRDGVSFHAQGDLTADGILAVRRAMKQTGAFAD
jgi:hypothetical protein